MRTSFNRRLQEAEARVRQRIEQRRRVVESRTTTAEEAVAAYERMISYVPETNTEPLPAGEAIRRYETMINDSRAGRKPTI